MAFFYSVRRVYEFSSRNCYPVPVFRWDFRLFIAYDVQNMVSLLSLVSQTAEYFYNSAMVILI